TPMHLWDLDDATSLALPFPSMEPKSGELVFTAQDVRQPVLVPFDCQVSSDPTNIDAVWTLVTGAGGGLARILVRDLFAQGYRKFILLGRSNVLDGIDDLTNRDGCELIPVKAELGDASAAGSLSRISEYLAKVEHVYHLAGVLHDSTVPNLDMAQYD